MPPVRVSAGSGSGGTLSHHPEDFWVDEHLPYAPSGEGEHLFLQVLKVGRTTPEVVRELADRFVPGEGKTAVGTAGLKDRAAVTRQWVSLPWPSGRELPPLDTPPPVLEAGLDGIALPDAATLAPGHWVVNARRHRHKLKTGHVRSNRFRIRLRDVDEAAESQARTVLAELRRLGVPNRFGPQRFGRDGDNAEVARAILDGAAPRPRDRTLLRLLMSALQSDLFNRVLEHRLTRGLWTTALEGDLMSRHAPPAMFVVTHPEDEQPRMERMEISPTGPMFGRKTRPAEAAAAELENEVWQASGLTRRDRDRLGPGSRRPLRFPLDPEASVESPTPGTLLLSFTLPAGAYATVLLDEIVKPKDEFQRVAPTSARA